MMKVKIKIESNLKIKNIFETPLEIELSEDQATLKDVLQIVSKRFPPNLRFIEKGEMGDDLRQVYLNGQSHFSFSEGLQKKISDGDTVHVEAYMEPLAGG